MASATRAEARRRRQRRVRAKLSGTPQVPRLNVFRSLDQIYAQLIDDSRGHTLVSASTVDPDLRPKAAGLRKLEQAKLVGELLAQRAKAIGMDRAVFDRGGNRYHGRVKAVAEAARLAGLKF
jgi:large subunit ribosomal protein L18